MTIPIGYWTLSRKVIDWCDAMEGLDRKSLKITQVLCHKSALTAIELVHPIFSAKANNNCDPYYNCNELVTAH